MTQARDDHLAHTLLLMLSRSACSCQSVANSRDRTQAKWHVRAMATLRRCCHGLGLRQWISWSHMRPQSRTLLSLPRKLGALQRRLSGHRGRASGRTCQTHIIPDSTDYGGAVRVHGKEAVRM